MDVWMYVCNELISETAPTIFLKLGMKLGDNKGKEIARPDFFIKILILTDFGQTCQKMAKNHSFGTLRKKHSKKFSEIALKLSPKIVL